MTERLIIIQCAAFVTPFNRSGHRCWGWVATDTARDGRILAQGYGYAGCDQNIALGEVQFAAVIAGLDWANETRPRWSPAGYGVRLQTESRLVWRLLQGTMACPPGQLQRLYNEAIYLLGAVDGRVDAIDVEGNELAAAVARLAYQEFLQEAQVAA